MRALIVLLVLMLVAPLVGNWLVASANIPPPPLDSAAGHWIAVFGGLLVLLPIVGLILALRGFFRWHRGFHRRMRRDGLW